AYGSPAGDLESCARQTIGGRIAAAWTEGTRAVSTDSHSGLKEMAEDALAAVAYGPEAIVVVLAVAGAHGLGFTLPVTLAIAALLAVLTVSYRQVIAAFPNGGGAYAVAGTYLGKRVALVA